MGVLLAVRRNATTPALMTLEAVSAGRSGRTRYSSFLPTRLFAIIRLRLAPDGTRLPNYLPWRLQGVLPKNSPRFRAPPSRLARLWMYRAQPSGWCKAKTVTRFPARDWISVRP